MRNHRYRYVRRMGVLSIHMIMHKKKLPKKRQKKFLDRKNAIFQKNEDLWLDQLVRRLLFFTQTEFLRGFFTKTKFDQKIRFTSSETFKKWPKQFCNF